MAYEPVLDGSPQTNVYGEHLYKARVTFGAGTVSAIRSKDLTVTRPTATTLVLAFPKSYAEITSFHVGRKAAASVAGLEWVITTNALSTTGLVTLTSIESDAGTATTPADGDVAYIEIGVSCDVLNDLATAVTA
jgi:hypothetical protein